MRKAPLERDAAPPVYGSAGYTLRALNYKVSIPAALGKLLKDALGLPQGPPEPDVVLWHNKSGDQLVLECKASSFGAASSTTKQANKLLAACAVADRSLGASGEASLVYVLPEEDVAAQLQTLDELQQKLSSHAIPHGRYGTLGVAVNDEGLWVNLYINYEGQVESLDSVVGRNMVHEATDGDSRPLYLIPYDPASFGQQSKEEQEYCARELSQRVINFAISQVGQAPLPETLRIDGNDALKFVTHGISDKWDGNDKATLRVTVVGKLVEYLRRGGLKDKVSAKTGQYVEINLSDEDDRKLALDNLQTSESSRLEKAVGQLSLALNPREPSPTHDD